MSGAVSAFTPCSAYRGTSCAWIGVLLRFVGAICRGKEWSRMSIVGIQQDALNSLDKLITQAQGIVQQAKGQKVDKVKELCDLVDLTKRDLAAALVFRSKGNITFVELARRLSVNESTVRRWPEIHRALRAR